MNLITILEGERLNDIVIEVLLLLLLPYFDPVALREDRIQESARKISDHDLT